MKRFFTMDFVAFELAKKLKEKGFSCQYPIAMYNERGDFHALYSSAGIEYYYDYDDFDEHDCVCPTISQVLKWLREEKSILLEIVLWEKGWYYEVWVYGYEEEEKKYSTEYEHQSIDYESYEQAAFAGIEYVLDNINP